MRPSVTEIRLGAIYRLAARCGLSRSAVETLMKHRAGLGVVAARQLAGHWFTTEALRHVASAGRHSGWRACAPVKPQSIPAEGR